MPKKRFALKITVVGVVFAFLIWAVYSLAQIYGGDIQPPPPPPPEDARFVAPESDITPPPPPPEDARFVAPESDITPPPHQE